MICVIATVRSANREFRFINIDILIVHFIARKLGINSFDCNDYLSPRRKLIFVDAKMAN